MTLGEAKALLRSKLTAGDKLDCPTCTQRAAIYSRPLNATMAHSLVAMYRAWGRDWGDLPALRRKVALHHSNQEAQLRHFRLIEEHPDRREDGGHLGWWRVTDLGVRWVQGQATVPGRAVTYAGRFLALDGDQVSIRDVLGIHFDLREVMLGMPDG